jgi:hypothetical protein
MRLTEEAFPHIASTAWNERWQSGRKMIVESHRAPAHLQRKRSIERNLVHSDAESEQTPIEKFPIIVCYPSGSYGQPCPISVVGNRVIAVLPGALCLELLNPLRKELKPLLDFLIILGRANFTVAHLEVRKTDTGEKESSLIIPLVRRDFASKRLVSRGSRKQPVRARYGNGTNLYPDRNAVRIWRGSLEFTSSFCRSWET